MICQACQHESPPGNAFCGECGARLALVCGRCGQSNPAANTFCGECGQRLAAEPEVAKTAAAEPETGERRQLTVLFCDLVGSTDLSARLDPEEYGAALHTYHTRTDEVITRYGGYVAQHLGDGLLVYFGWPQTYDDAAERAVRAGLGLVEATATVQAGGAPLAARVGLHTGAVVVRDVGAGERHETLAVGDTPNVAARVQGAAEPGQVFITAATHRLVAGLFLVEDRGACPLKGVPQPIELYRVVQSSGVRGRLGAAAAHGFTPFVNRSEERAMLRSRFERVCEGEGQVVLLVGEAGIGKSRLVQVLREELADTPHTWLETGGSPHFANTPFHAVTELLRERRPWDDDAPATRAKGVVESLRRAGVDPSEALSLVAPLLDLPVPEGYRPVVAAPEVVRKRLLATLAEWVCGTARLQPLVILVEDMHWVDPSSLELLQVLVDQGISAPLLLLLTARPQFQVPWPLRAHHTQLTLNHLSKRHVRDMVLGVAAQAHLLAEVIDAVAARTDGVPLFVEELTKAVVEVGAAAAAREIPSTLVDSLMARLDRLGPHAREVAQVGAVCGRQFTFEMVHAVHPIAEAELEAALHKLVDAELVHERGLVPQATYTFKHALVQDAAYESLLKSRRRTLHGHAATALTDRFPEVAAEHPELLAHHHELAAQVEPAIAAWQRASGRALDGGAPREAEHHLMRALNLLNDLPDAAARDGYEFQVQLSLGAARIYCKGYGSPEAAEAFARAAQVGERMAEPAQFMTLLFGMFISGLTREGPAAARPLGERFVASAEKSPVLVARALKRFVPGLVDMYLGQPVTARKYFAEALAVYEDDGLMSVVIELPVALLPHLADLAWQLGFADQARAHIGEVMARAEKSPRPMDLEFAAHYAAIIFALLRDPVQAASHVEIAARSEYPNPVHAAVIEVMRGWCLSQTGEVATGLEALRAGIERLVASGHHLSLERYHSFLADALVQAGDREGALRALADGEQASFGQLLDRPGTLARRADLIVDGGAGSAEVETAFGVALETARRHRAKSYELRIATSYARWLREQDRRTEACELLGPLYVSFSEGFDTRDLCEARELLEGLNGQSGGAEAFPRSVVTHAGGS